MKTFLPLAFLSFFQIALFAQTGVPVTFIIDDGDTHKFLSGANVAIKQTGYDTKASDASGKVQFQNVPIGQIDFNVSKEGYQFYTEQKNVSTEIKNNTFYISLQKIPTADDKMILLTGEVTDAGGKEIKDAWVEAKIADVERTVQTNASGNYTLDITPNPKFPATEIRVEVKKGDCKKVETIALNRTNMISKDFKLDCIGEKPTSGDDGEDKPEVKDDPINKPLGENTLNRSTGSIKMTVDRFEQKGRTATFYFTLENMTASKAILETSTHGSLNELIDQEGNFYKSNYIVVGNAEASHGSGANIKLIYNNPVKGYVQFDVGAVQVKKAGLLKVWFYGYSGEPSTIDFTNLPIK